MKSEKLQFDRSLATDSEATYRLRTKSHLCLDAGIGGTFYSIPVDSYRNFRRILLYAAMRTISSNKAQKSQDLLFPTRKQSKTQQKSQRSTCFDQKTPKKPIKNSKAPKTLKK